MFVRSMHRDLVGYRENSHRRPNRLITVAELARRKKIPVDPVQAAADITGLIDRLLPGGIDPLARLAPGEVFDRAKFGKILDALVPVVSQERRRFLAAALKSKGLSLYRLSELAELDHKTISNWLSGKTLDLREGAKAAIARTLDICVEDFPGNPADSENDWPASQILPILRRLNEPEKRRRRILTAI